MPAVSFYLNQETLDAVRARAKAHNIPVSTIIREAVEQYLKINEAAAAKERVLNLLAKEKPLGAGVGAWEELHEERSGADVDRG